MINIYNVVVFTAVNSVILLMMKSTTKVSPNIHIKQTMKAVTYKKYGSPDVLAIEDIPRCDPKPDEVRIRIVKTSANPSDWRILRSDPFFIRLVYGIFTPRLQILGNDIAGVVDAVGENVKEYKIGDQIFGDFENRGGFAQYVCVNAAKATMIKKPQNIDFSAASAIPTAAVTALQALRDTGKLKDGDKVLINGASGGVGSFAVQFAKQLCSNTEVTAVCSTRNLETMRSLGADRVVDYTKEDCTKGCDGYYDVILDAAAFRSVWDFSPCLKSNGRYVFVGGSFGNIWKLLKCSSWLALTGSRKSMSMVMAEPTAKDMDLIAEFVQNSKVTHLIHRSLHLEEVPDALWELENRGVRGKLVITMASLDK